MNGAYIFHEPRLTPFEKQRQETTMENLKQICDKSNKRGEVGSSPRTQEFKGTDREETKKPVIVSRRDASATFSN